MPSRDVAGRASQYGVSGEYRVLQKLRRGEGLSSESRTVQLPLQFGRALGLNPTRSDVHLGLYDCRLLAEALEVQVAIQELSASQRVVAFITWNFVPSDPSEAALLSSYVGVRVRWMKRVSAYVRSQLALEPDERSIPKAWLDERVFREQSDEVVLQLALRLSRAEDALREPVDAVTHATRSLMSFRQPSSMPLDNETENALEETANLAVSFLETEEPSSFTVDGLMANASDLSAAYSYASPQKILRASEKLTKEALRRLDQTRHPETRNDLYLLVGKLFGLMSYGSLDLGDADLSLKHALASLKAGRFASHDELMAWALGTQAMILRFKRDFEKSLAPGNEALRLRVAGPARARIFAQNALAYSELGQPSRVTESLNSAEREMASRTSGDSNLDDGIFVFPQSKFHYYAGSGLLGLGPEHANAAVEQSAMAIELFMHGSTNDRSYSDELLARIHQATSELRRDELDAVPDVLQRLFDSPIDQRTSWHVQWLRRASEGLQRNARYKSSQVSQRLETLTNVFQLEIEAGRDEGGDSSD